MPDSRSGHHGDIAYLFENNGFDASPTDSTFKGFGGNARLETFEGSHQAVRVFNAGRTAAEIIEQTFDGAWSITTEGFTEPPWWFSTIYGSPSSTETATTGLYDHVYDLANNNDPQSLRLYMPTDGFSNYKRIGGCVVASVTVDQDSESSPTVTITGAYASEPEQESSLSPSVPSFAESSFTNRHAELKFDSTTVGRAQNTTLTLQANTELVGEIGSEDAVDFSPKAFEPSVTWDKILWTTQSVDPLSVWKTASQVTIELIYDNGASGTDQYIVDFNVSEALPNEWSESGRNDPSADLMEELVNMGEDATVTVTEDAASPP